VRRGRGPGCKMRGIYYVRMATDGDYGGTPRQTFARQLRRAEDLCTTRHDRAGSAFWQFLDGLTSALVGNPFEKTADRWGWSNLLKIGWSVGNPNQWRPPVEPKLKDDQRDVCVCALRQEFEKLHKTLIVVCTGVHLACSKAVIFSRSWLT
jgi:hypothetical protein